MKVSAVGMCRTDAQILDGYFKDYHPLTFPMTPGHEIAGTVKKTGSLMPKTAGRFLDLSDGKIVKAFAFFDSVVFNDFWQRIKPVTAK